MIRRRVLFSGRVQGVGFRATTAALARQLPISGFVRNLPDGRVELEVQGEADVVHELLSRIQREFPGNISKVAHEETAILAEPGRFEIRM